MPQAPSGFKIGNVKLKVKKAKMNFNSAKRAVKRRLKPNSPMKSSGAKY